MKQYLMALDQGTTSCRCILFDRSGHPCSMAQKEFSQIYPQPGWVEQDPMEIWSSQLAVATEAISKIGATSHDIAAIGITNQRETTVVWDRRTGMPIYNAIVWQCRRTAEQIAQLEADGLSDYVHQTTGLIPDAYFSASKIAWILDHVPGARERAEAGELLFGTIDTWLIWNLTRGAVHVTDYTNASRTMLFDIHKLCWDDTLLHYFQIPKAMLPEVRSSGEVYGYTATDILGSGIPISGVAGDQQAALFGQCCFSPGEVKNTYGTGCFLLMNTGKTAVKSQKGLLTTIAAGKAGALQYALEGSVFVAGAGIQWLRDELGILQNAKQSEEYARSVPSNNGVYIVPSFTGMGAPYWNPHSRGTIVGLTRDCTKAHLVRAMLESIAYQTYDLMSAMELESGVSVSSVKVDGGAAVNDFLLQFQSDLLNISVLRPDCVEITALGAAYLAGLGIGWWESTEEICENRRAVQQFSPQMSAKERENLLKGWKRAVDCAIYWAKDSE